MSRVSNRYVIAIALLVLFIGQGFGVYALARPRTVLTKIESGLKTAKTTIEKAEDKIDAAKDKLDASAEAEKTKAIPFVGPVKLDPAPAPQRKGAKDPIAPDVAVFGN